MTAFLLVLATQTLDSLGSVLAISSGAGHEVWPTMAPVFAWGGMGAFLTVKLGVAAAAAAVIARVRPSLAPWVGLVGCADALSGLFAVAGGVA